MAIISDLKFEGTNQDFVWRSPVTDFNTGSRLTVYESQEALFYLNGSCVGVLGAGSHILETQNIPFLRGIINKITGNQSIFHAQVVFVNKVELDMKWGVGDIVYEDAEGPVFNIGANGQINLTAVNSRKMVEKLVGVAGFLTKDQVITKFRDLISAEIMDKLVKTMHHNAIPITNVSMHLLDISKSLEPEIDRLFSDYGFELSQFRIRGVMVPEDDPEYRRLKRLKADSKLRIQELQLEQQEAIIREQTKAAATKIEAEAMAAKRSLEGYTYQQERQFDVMHSVADNEGGGTSSAINGMMQIGLGLGAMGAVGGMVADSVKAVTPNMPGVPTAAQAVPEAPSPTPPPEMKKCSGCAAEMPANAKFCLECGQKAEDPSLCKNCGQPTGGGKFCMNCGEKTAESKPICPSCKREFDSPAKFCPDCGAKL